jgi:branched-chain amino acid transport system permease protein
VFHVTQELFWTFLLGWQRVAMGIFILVIVMYFPAGVAGWLQQRMPRGVAGAPSPFGGQGASAKDARE